MITPEMIEIAKEGHRIATKWEHPRYEDRLVDLSVIRNVPNPGKRPPSYSRLLQEDKK